MMLPFRAKSASSVARVFDRLDAAERLSAKRLRLLEQQQLQVQRLRAMNARLATLLLRHQSQCPNWPDGQREIVEALIEG